MASRAELPIDGLLPEIIAALRSSSGIVVTAQTGAGKTTRVPPALVDAGLARDRKLVMLEPRRIAARVAAQRMSVEAGTTLGREVGYQVRFERRATKTTKVLVATEGVLLRLLQDDPFLDRFGVVVFDEFHERSLDSDLALAMVRRVQRETRPSLKIVVMSATLDATPVAKFLGDVPVVESSGRSYPLEIAYGDRIDDRPLPEQVADGIDLALSSDSPGDVLVFLPGVGEIKRTHRRLQESGVAGQVEVRELYGDLASDEQDAALRKTQRRRVILATNVAETSITVDGVTAVVDSGRARVPRFDPDLGLDRLELRWISKASADQRAGRAGRLAPGRVFRLWTQRQHSEFRDEELPQVHRVDLTAAVLELLAWGESDPAAFPWYDAPEQGSVARAMQLLQDLTATDEGRVTPVGEQLAALPLPPRLGRLVSEAQRGGVLERGALLAALLAERSRIGRSKREGAQATDSDLLDLLVSTELNLARDSRSVPYSVRRARDQIVRRLTSSTQSPTATGSDRSKNNTADEALLRAIFAAYPDRLARRREPRQPRARMVGGKGVRLADESSVRDSELFVCVDVTSSTDPRREAIVHAASPVDVAWISAEHIEAGVQLRFDEGNARVEAVHRTMYRDLVLSESPTAIPSSPEVATLLADAATKNLDQALALDDPVVAGFMARVRWLREWCPELELPAWSADDLAALLPTLCAGKRSFAELRRAPLIDFLRGALDRHQQTAVDREAPERISVPSGSQVALQYEPGKPPVLAVRIQEMFGATETPRVAAGRVRVLLHLLAPNRRPQQVTDDLASFWETTYSVVRKELRARYPKHSWPENPLEAPAESRPRRKKPRGGRG